MAEQNTEIGLLDHQACSEVHPLGWPRSYLVSKTTMSIFLQNMATKIALRFNFSDVF